MLKKYLKKAPLHSRSDDTNTQQIVRDILHDIENGGDAVSYTHLTLPTKA